MFYLVNRHVFKLKLKLKFLCEKFEVLYFQHSVSFQCKRKSENFIQNSTNEYWYHVFSMSKHKFFYRKSYVTVRKIEELRYSTIISVGVERVDGGTTERLLNYLILLCWRLFDLILLYWRLSVPSPTLTIINRTTEPQMQRSDQSSFLNTLNYLLIQNFVLIAFTVAIQSNWTTLVVIRKIVQFYLLKARLTNTTSIILTFLYIWPTILVHLCNVVWKLIMRNEFWDTVWAIS